MRLIITDMKNMMISRVVFADQATSAAESHQIVALQKICDEGDASTCLLLGYNYKYGDFPFK